MEKNEIEYEINRFKQSNKPLMIKMNGGETRQVNHNSAIIKIEEDNLVINSIKLKLNDIKQVYVKDI